MKINLAQLSVGFHELDFEETSASLDIEDQVMFPNPVFSHLEVDKSETHVYIHAKVTSLAHFTCDRCLREFDQTLSGELRLYYQLKGHGTPRLGNLQRELDDDIRYYRLDSPEIDLGHDIRDTILLEVPMKRLCSPDCKGLCPGCGRDLNVESCVCGEKPVDPRWEALKKLLE